jgi:hypothetical protein
MCCIVRLKHHQGLFGYDTSNQHVRRFQWIQALSDLSFPITKSKAESFLDTLFKGLSSLVYFLSCYSSTTSPTSAGGEVDVTETIAMMAVLQQFLRTYGVVIRVGQIGGSVITAGAAADASVAPSEQVLTPFYLSMLSDIEKFLMERLRYAQDDGIKWMHAQKYDPKRPGVFPPFAKFVTLVQQSYEMCGGQVCVFVCTRH